MGGTKISYCGIDILNEASNNNKRFETSQSHAGIALPANGERVPTNLSGSMPDANDYKATGVKKPQKINAEKYFDTGLYGTVSYFGQALTSVLLTQWIKHGSGKEKFDTASRWLGRNVLEKQFKQTPENAAKLSNTLLVATTLIMVGNCFLAPVKYMEDHKPEFVRKINDWLNERREKKGDVISPEERREQDEAIAHIAEQPRQTWGSLIGARVFSLGAIYAAIALVGGKNNKIMEDASANAASKTMNSLGVPKTKAYSKTVQDFGRIAFVDFAYSLVGAGALYLYSHVLAPPKQKKKGEEKTLDESVGTSRQPDVLGGDTTTGIKTSGSGVEKDDDRSQGWKFHLKEKSQSFVESATRPESSPVVERI